MSTPVVFLSQAEDDIDVAYSAYQQQRISLGDRFLRALRDILDRIEANPQLYGVFYRDIRAAPLHTFPYVVYYRCLASHVLVVAVQHARRSARAWQGRV